MDELLNAKTIAPVSAESFETFIAAMEHFSPLSGPLKTKLRAVLHETTYQKGRYILNAGAKQKLLWFNLDGLLREISVDRHTFDARTSWYWFDASFVYASPGFFDQQPAQISIEVIKDAKVLLLTFEQWKSLKSNLPEAEALIEKIRTQQETRRKDHLREIHELSTAARYRIHQRQINQLLPAVKLRYIAEYLGMSTDTLGKLRRKFIRYRQPVD
ncbi:Crp/Fnr family transcriptional regulator [Pedobacter paludis]|uniref:Crp/Fnr family transcriptional regulator n=1 Tax=Pedobacter paludis TaxID=2203212 RepID=A0A317F234_9SPHI|nr:Crp/Fnr family transcriptional regulator [Pedobacter paludis]PWS33300.1 hypothetical protein DF947_01355 [Pedobacter paludis]